ncbi:hypothetical protein ACEPAF_224 [Sanghuangporus sanghuang]
MSKVLLVFFTIGDIEGGGGGNVQHATNVLRLCMHPSLALQSHSNSTLPARAVQDNTTDGRRQIVFYQSGVGSEANFKGDPVTGTTLMQAFGTAVASKIRDAYAFIAQNFDAGDDICIFGFSRGAYTARKVSGLIDKIGLLEREKLGYFFEIWKELVDGKTPTIPPGTRQTKIKCVGVWDTVDSVLNGPTDPIIDALSIKDTSLPASVEIALHGLSLQENRKKFLPTLWTNPSSNQILKQIWFPGAHSDVGGGYERHELADIALFWMAGEVRSFINLDLAFLRQSAQQNPDPWGESQPHNAYEEASIAQQIAVGHSTRLEGNKITRNDQFHQSILVSPTNLKDPKYMITLNSLKSAFGSSWTPGCPALNDFEDLCKKNWGKPPIESDGPIKFESPSDLFGSGLYWVAASSGFLPQEAISAGMQGDNIELFVARVAYKGGLHPGKATRAKCYIGYDGDEIEFTSGYEILVGSESAVKWVPVTGGYLPEKLNGSIPIPVGRENNEPLYSAQADIHNSVHCGKVWYGMPGELLYEPTRNFQTDDPTLQLISRTKARKNLLTTIES